MKYINGSPFFLLLMTASAAAQPSARYTVNGNCFGTNPSAEIIQVGFLGNESGTSDFSCQDAAKNLHRLCQERATQARFAYGHAYRDYVVVEKSVSKAQGSASSFGYSEGRVLFGLLAGWGSISSSSQAYSAKSQSARVAPEPIQLGEDCEINTAIQKSPVRSLQSSRYAD